MKEVNACTSPRTRDENEDEDNLKGYGKSVWPITWRSHSRAGNLRNVTRPAPAHPDRFHQKWQTNGNNSQARIRVPN